MTENEQNFKHPASEPEYWQKRWIEGRTAWDQGGIHPLFPKLLKRAEESGLRPPQNIIEPGCGRAHTAAMLAQNGFSVTAFDVSSDAINAAKELYGTVQRLTLKVGDVFHPPTEWHGAFDAVYDRAVLCALPAPERPRYLKSCATWLKQEGLFLSLPFTRLHIEEKDGPPFAIAEDDFRRLLSVDFECISHEQIDNQDNDAKIKTEMVAVWRKR